MENSIEITKANCCSCRHWKNQQAELDYDKHYGICTCYRWQFKISNTADCVLLDRENITTKHKGVNRFENQNNEVPIGRSERSRYCLVTEEEFVRMFGFRSNMKPYYQTVFYYEVDND